MYTHRSDSVPLVESSYALELRASYKHTQTNREMIREGDLRKHVLPFEGASYRRHTKVDVDGIVCVCPYHNEPNHPARAVIYM